MTNRLRVVEGITRFLDDPPWNSREGIESLLKEARKVHLDFDVPFVVLEPRSIGMVYPDLGSVTAIYPRPLKKSDGPYLESLLIKQEFENLPVKNCVAVAGGDYDPFFSKLIEEGYTIERSQLSAK